MTLRRHTGVQALGCVLPPWLPHPLGRDDTMIGNLSGVHLIAILAVVLLLFGAPKLPALARSLGQSMRILKQEVSSTDTEADAPTAPTTPHDQRDSNSVNS